MLLSEYANIFFEFICLAHSYVILKYKLLLYFSLKLHRSHLLTVFFFLPTHVIFITKITYHDFSQNNIIFSTSLPVHCWHRLVSKNVAFGMKLVLVELCECGSELYRFESLKGLPVPYKFFLKLTVCCSWKGCLKLVP